MTRFPDDPEVLADLRFRNDSEHDTSRNSLVTCECGCVAKVHDAITGACSECGCLEYARASALIWKPAPIVERRPCSKGCGALVDLTRDALDQMAAFSAMLERRREQPITSVPCPACKRVDDELASQQRGTRAPASAQPQRRHEQTQIAVLDDYRPSGMRGRKGRP